MENHKAAVLKKLGRRKKMFEDYINLVKKPEVAKVRPGLEQGTVLRFKSRTGDGSQF